MRSMVATISLTVCLAATACETPKRDPQVSDAQDRYWTDVIQRRCVLVTSSSFYVISEERIRDDIVIHGVHYGEGDWIRVDFTSQAIGGNIYYNQRTRRTYCGKQSWRDAGLTFIPASGKPKTPVSRRWTTYDPTESGPYVSCRSAAGNVSQMAESLCISFGGVVVGRSIVDAPASDNGEAGGRANEPAPATRPVYRPSRAVTLVKCRFPDGTVIGEEEWRCRSFGGELVDKKE